MVLFTEILKLRARGKKCEVRKRGKREVTLSQKIGGETGDEDRAERERERRSVNTEQGMEKEYDYGEN